MIQVMVPGGGKDDLSRARNALGELVIKPKIRAWLRANEPKTLAFAEQVLVELDSLLLGSDERIRGMLAVADSALAEAAR